MAINATSSATDASTSTGVNRMADMSSEQFMKILITQLQNQDPMNPSDTNAMLEQISSIRNIESQLELQTRLEALVSQNEISSAGNLIGKFVTGLSESLQDVEGIVESIRIEDGKPILMVNDGTSSVRMPTDNLIQVYDAGDYDAAVTQSLLASMLMLDSNALIGKEVEGKDGDGKTRSGIVTSVTVDDGNLMLELDTGHVLPAGGVTRFAAAD